MKDIEIHVVSLVSAVQRREYMKSMLDGIGEKYSFFDAIDGSTAIFQSYDRSKITAAELGCALSHYALYQRLLNSKNKAYLILEDDSTLEAETLSLLPNLLCSEADWDILLLGHHPVYSRELETIMSFWGRFRVNSKVVIGRASEAPCGTYGYLVSRSGAKKLLKNKEYINKPIDHFYTHNDEVKIYISKPRMVNIHEELSDDYHTMHERERRFQEIRVTKSESNKSLKVKFLCFIPARMKRFLKYLYLCLFVRKIYRREDL